MNIRLTDHDKQWIGEGPLRGLTVAETDVAESQWLEYLKEAMKAHPEYLPAMQEAWARYSLLWNAEAKKRRAQAQPIKAEPQAAKGIVREAVRKPHWLEIAWKVAVLLLLSLIAARAEAQSQLEFIRFLDSAGNAIANGFYAYPFDFKCGANLTCTGSGNVLTMVAGAGGAPAWDDITLPDANLSLNMAAYTTVFTWNAATGASVMFRLTDTLNNTGTGYLFQVDTASGSGVKPVRFTALGTSNGVEMSTVGVLAAIGSGGITATTGDSATSFFSSGTLEIGIGGTGATSFLGSRCIESNAGGTALVVAAGACGAAGANTALSNLAAVAINLPLLPDAAAADDFGSATLPFKDIFFAGSSGTPGTNNFRITGASTSGTRVITAADGASVTVIADAGAANNFLTAISTAGAISKAQPAFSNLSGAATDAQVPNNITIDLAATATALAADPAGCTAGGLNFTNDINTAGTSTCADVRTASATQTGIAELATTAEVAAGTDTGRTATPSGIAPTIQSGSYLACADAGANDTYTCTMTPTLTAYTTGMEVIFKANTANTGAATLNINSLGAKTIVKLGGGITTALADNDLRAGQWTVLVYDGTNFQMQGQLGNAGGGGDSTKTHYLPLKCDTPRSSTLAGNSFWTVGARTAFDNGHWEFVKDVEGKIYCNILIPNTIAGTPAAEIVLRIAANATSGVTSLQVSTVAVADNESLNGAFTAETVQDITVPGTAYLTETVTFTLTAAPTALDHLFVEIFHDGDKAEDTLAVNTELQGAWLKIDLTE